MGDRLVILAGGASSRMKQSVTSAGLDTRLMFDADRHTKSMIRLGAEGRPFLDYLLYNARSAGCTDIVLVVSEQDMTMRSHFGGEDKGNMYHGLSISYAVQRIPPGRAKPMGTADALLQALHAMPAWSGSGFTVCNSDNLYSSRAFAAMGNVGATGGLIDYDRDALGLAPERTAQFAVIGKSAEGWLETIIERPTDEDVARCRSANGRVGVSMNLYRFRYDMILPFLESVPEHPMRREKELPEAVRLMVEAHPDEMRVVEFAEPVPDLTSKDDIVRMQEILAASFPAALWEL